MRVAILLFCSALAFGQDASSTPRTESLPPPTSVPEEKQSAAGPNGFKKFWTELTPGAAIQQATQAAAANRAPQLGALDILSNTYGIDFGPYLQALVKDVRKKWFSIIPASDQMKKGKLAIQFDIAKDGKVADMRLVTSSGDRSLTATLGGASQRRILFHHCQESFRTLTFACVSAITTIRTNVTSMFQLRTFCPNPHIQTKRLPCCRNPVSQLTSHHWAISTFRLASRRQLQPR